MDAEETLSPAFDSRTLNHVKLPVFEGPLDLLLYLIKKDELEAYLTQVWGDVASRFRLMAENTEPPAEKKKPT